MKTDAQLAKRMGTKKDADDKYCRPDVAGITARQVLFVVGKRDEGKMDHRKRENIGDFPNVVT